MLVWISTVAVAFIAFMFIQMRYEGFNPRIIPPVIVAGTIEYFIMNDASVSMALTPLALVGAVLVAMLTDFIFPGWNLSRWDVGHD